MISIIFLVLYFLLLIIHIGGEWFKNVKIRLITKPFLMPLLILYYVFNLNLGILNWFFIVGLIFAWFGDFFLMVEKEGKWFIYGLGSFLICQIFFIISFALSIANILSFPFWGFFLILFEIFIMSFILFRIQGKMGDLKIPTYVYVAAIFTMGLFA
ncbi:MAG: lysoplasmalogenase, partial [Candidatus Lokiarchaeota archaeon]